MGFDLFEETIPEWSYTDDPLKIVDVHCDMDTLRQRNIERGDRGENQSETQRLCVDKDVKYDCHIDSGVHNIDECADMLVEMVGLSSE